MPQRLNPEDWLGAGFRTLAARGPAALKAEVLARDLGTTKGSFYWHFKDVPTFRAQMLALWHARAVADIIEALADIADPKDRLRALGQTAARPAPDHPGGARVEAANPGLGTCRRRCRARRGGGGWRPHCLPARVALEMQPRTPTMRC